MTDRRSWPLIVLAVLVVGVLTRAVPLLYSPLPATLDGFRYVSLAASFLESGQLPLGRIQADELLFTTLLAVASRLTGASPLEFAQPLVVTTGATGSLVAVALTARTGRALDWSGRRVRTAALVAGLALALDGLYVRRTGVPDEEAIGILLVPLLALAVHRTFADGNRAWGCVSIVFAAVFPALHNLSSIVAATVVTGVVAIHIAAAPDRRRIILGVGSAVAFWGYIFGYFAVAARLGIPLTYTGLVREHPDLLVAWVVALALALAWYATASGRARAAALFSPVALWFLVVVANFVRPIYPGTIATPSLVLGLVALFVVPAALAAIGAARVPARATPGDTTVAVALLAGPAAITFFALTATLTPAFFDTVMRAQSFAHPGAFVLAGVAVVSVAGRRWSISRVLAIVLVVTTMFTVPLAHVHLDTGAYPSTVFESEYAATGFASAHVDGSFAVDDRLSRLSGHSYGGSGTTAPTRRWLRGGSPPPCPTLAQRSWATTGAHFYPAPAATIPPDEFARWRARNDVVYAAGGRNPLWLVTPRRPGAC